MRVDFYQLGAAPLEQVIASLGEKLLKDGEKHPIEKTGTKLRSLMPWIKKRDIKGSQASYE